MENRTPSGSELVPRVSGVAYSRFAENDGSSARGLFEYWGMFRRHGLDILLITVAGGLISVFVTLLQTPVYEARTALEIQSLNQNFLNIQQVNPISEGSAYTDVMDLQTQAKLLESENLIRRVVLKLRDRIPQDLKVSSGTPSLWRTVFDPLVTWKNQLSAVAANWTGREPKSAGIAGPRATTAPTQNQPAVPSAKGAPAAVPAEAEDSGTSDPIDVRAVARNLKVRAARQSRIIEAFYDSTDAQFAADFANTLAQEFIESNMEARWRLSEQTGQWLSHQLSEMRVKLEASEDKLQAYARSTGLLFTSGKNNISEEKLRQLQGELSKAEAYRVAAQSRWEISRSSPPEALPDVLNDTSLRVLQDKVTELRRQYAELNTIYTPQHSKVARVQAQLAELEAALQKERSRIIDRLANEYGTAVRRERLLRAEFGNQSRLVNAQAEKAIQYNILQHEAASNRQLYDAMLQRVKEASVASAIRASNVRIVDPAERPAKPHKPNLAINTALGLTSALLIGVAFAALRERADRTLRTPGETQFWLNVPELQVIPTLALPARSDSLATSKNGRGTTLSLSMPPEFQEGARPGGAALSIRGNGVAPFPVELASWHQKPGLIADSFRSLLTSILLSRGNPDRPRVIVLTSAGPGEGKTTVVSNLAIVLADIGRRVLIIDADLRKPRMHELFGLRNSRGLKSLLDGRLPIAEATQEVVQETAIPGLSVLPSGPETQSSANLLYSEKLPMLLDVLKQHFDMIIIDTPPMLLMSDARVIGRMTDGVILVTRAAQTLREAAVAANQRFAEDGTRVLGTILNDWDPAKSHTPYLYDYQYRYYRAS